MGTYSQEFVSSKARSSFNDDACELLALCECGIRECFQYPRKRGALSSAQGELSHLQSQGWSLKASYSFGVWKTVRSCLFGIFKYSFWKRKVFLAELLLVSIMVGECLTAWVTINEGSFFTSAFLPAPQKNGESGIFCPSWRLRLENTLAPATGGPWSMCG